LVPRLGLKEQRAGILQVAINWLAPGGPPNLDRACPFILRPVNLVVKLIKMGTLRRVMCQSRKSDHS
jgi:hypothetical protein